MSQMNEAERSSVAEETTTQPIEIPEGVFESLAELFATMFTKSSIENDEYLNSRVTATGSIAIDTVLESPKVLSICNIPDIIKKALSECRAIYITEDGVRSLAKPEQNTLILRDIPSSTSTDDIIGIFTSLTDNDGNTCPTVQSVRSDVGDTWFVVFSSEENARTALLNIRNATFNDQPIRARLKTESITKSFYSGSSGYGFGGQMMPIMDGYGSPAGSPPSMMQGMYFPPGYMQAPGQSPFIPPMVMGVNPGMPMMGYPMMMPRPMWGVQGMPYQQQPQPFMNGGSGRGGRGSGRQQRSPRGITGGRGNHDPSSGRGGYQMQQNSNGGFQKQSNNNYDNSYRSHNYRGNNAQGGYHNDGSNSNINSDDKMMDDNGNEIDNRNRDMHTFDMNDSHGMYNDHNNASSSDKGDLSHDPDGAYRQDANKSRRNKTTKGTSANGVAVGNKQDGSNYDGKVSNSREGDDDNDKRKSGRDKKKGSSNNGSSTDKDRKQDNRNNSNNRNQKAADFCESDFPTLLPSATIASAVATAPKVMSGWAAAAAGTVSTSPPKQAAVVEHTSKASSNNNDVAPDTMSSSAAAGVAATSNTAAAVVAPVTVVAVETPLVFGAFDIPEDRKTVEVVTQVVSEGHEVSKKNDNNSNSNNNNSKQDRNKIANKERSNASAQEAAAAADSQGSGWGKKSFLDVVTSK